MHYVLNYWTVGYIITIISVFNVRKAMKNYWEDTFMQFYPKRRFKNGVLNRSAISTFIGFSVLSIGFGKHLFATTDYSFYFVFGICLVIPFAFTSGLLFLFKPKNTEYTDEQKEIEKRVMKHFLFLNLLLIPILYGAGVAHYFRLT